MIFFHMIRNLSEAVVDISLATLQYPQPTMYVGFIHSRQKMTAASKDVWSQGKIKTKEWAGGFWFEKGCFPKG